MLTSASTKQASLLLSAEAIRNGAVSGWEKEVFDSFEGDMLSETDLFPCVFGVEGFKQGNLRFAFAADPLNENDLMKVRNSLIEYSEMFRTLGRMTSFAVFFQPSEQALSMEAYEEQFWNVLKFLHENDPKEWPGDIPTNTDDKMWEFCFNGEPIFVVCNTPAHQKRRSRSAKTFMITFQPRWVFEDLKGEKGEKGRALVRKRLAKYDEVEVHPAMGFYGEEENREWKQYFIRDTNEDIPEECPFHAMMKEQQPREETLTFDEVRIIKGEPSTVQQAITTVTRADHYLFVRNDSANHAKLDKVHEMDCSLINVRGKLTVTAVGQEFELNAGERLLLPANTSYSTLSGERGCMYLEVPVQEIQLFGQPEEDFTWKKFLVNDTEMSVPAECPFHARMNAANSEPQKLVFDEVKIMKGQPVTLDQAILKVIPVDHYACFVNDAPNYVSDVHSHTADESLFIVHGKLTVMAEGQEHELLPGDRLILPGNVVHNSKAGEEGCIFLIVKHEEEAHYMVRA